MEHVQRKTCKTTNRLSNSNILSSFVSKISLLALSSLLSCFSALFSAFCNLGEKSDVQPLKYSIEYWVTRLGSCLGVGKVDDIVAFQLYWDYS